MKRKKQAFEEQSFDPRPEWHGYLQKKEDESWYKNWRYDDTWVFRPFEKQSYKDWKRESNPFETDLTKRTIGGGYNKQGVRFTVNARGEVKPEGCDFKTEEDDDWRPQVRTASDRKLPAFSILKESS